MATPSDKLMFEAASSGNLDIVKLAVTAGADVNAMEEYGGTALHKAAGEGYLEIVEFLVNAGADIEKMNGVDMPPAMTAATSGHVKIVQFLVEKGAKVSHDLLSSVNLKVNILEENAEAGMVRPEAAAAWKQFLEWLITIYEKQNPA